MMEMARPELGKSMILVFLKRSLLLKVVYGPLSRTQLAKHSNCKLGNFGLLQILC